MQNQSDELHEKKRHARIKLTLRALVAIYLLYLTKGIIESAVKKTSPLPLWVTVLVSAVFLSAAVAFGIYAWREYSHALAATANEWKEGCPEEADTDSADRPGLR